MNKRELIKYIQEQKTGPCEDCGRVYPYWVMQFDHCKGEKRFNISDVGRHIKVSLAKVKEEIDKCDLLCANCHHIRTHRTNTKKPESSLWNQGYELINRPMFVEGKSCRFCANEVNPKGNGFLMDRYREVVFCSIECLVEESKK